MNKILTQQDWDSLPVHTFARLTRIDKGVPRTVHVTRAAGDISLEDSGYLLLGGERWSEIFADADTAYTLFVPAGRAIDVSELTALLNKAGHWAPLEIACGHRRFRPGGFAAGKDRPAGEAARLETRAMDDKDPGPRVAHELLNYIDAALRRGSEFGVQITQGTLLSVAADGREWNVTGAEERDGTVVITTGLVPDERPDPAPRWITTDEYLRRSNEAAGLTHRTGYPEDAPEGQLVRHILETEASLPLLEQALESSEYRLRGAAAEAGRRRRDLAVARYLCGVTNSIEETGEVAFNV